MPNAGCWLSLTTPTPHGCVELRMLACRSMRARRPIGPTCCGDGQGGGADQSLDPDGGGYNGLNSRHNHNAVGRAPRPVGCSAHNSNESGRTPPQEGARICGWPLGLPTTELRGLRSGRIARTSCRVPARGRECALSGQCRDSPAGPRIGRFIWLVCLRAADGHCLHAGFPFPRSNSLVDLRGRHCGSGRGWLGGRLPGRPTGLTAMPR